MLQVCRECGFAIEHEDAHGGFVVRRSADERDLEWFGAAVEELPPDPKDVERCNLCNRGAHRCSICGELTRHGVIICARCALREVLAN